MPQVQFLDSMVDIPAACCGYSGRKLWRFRSCVSRGRAMLGSTVDTCSFQFTKLLFSDPAIDSRPALCSVFCRIWCRGRVDNGIGMLGLVLLVSPHLASGTCYALVLGWFLEEFHDFLREGVHSAPEVDSRAALLWPSRSHRCGSWLCS